MASGVIAPPVKAPLIERLLHIERELDALITLWSPGSCAVENVFYHKNPKKIGRASCGERV